MLHRGASSLIGVASLVLRRRPKFTSSRAALVVAQEQEEDSASVSSILGLKEANRELGRCSCSSSSSLRSFSEMAYPKTSHQEQQVHRQEQHQKQQQQQQQQQQSSRNLACPICLEPLSREGPAGFNRSAICSSIFRCTTCSKSYPSNGTYIDLTLSAHHSTWQETLPFGVRLFRTKWMSLEYEERWRKSFEKFGFPGPDGEVKLAESFLRSAVESMGDEEDESRQSERLLLDISCGTGLHSRRFAKCAAFSAVIAADFSEAMLDQCHVLLKEEDQSPHNDKIVLIRADASRLPFATGSISAVYAGAALHCWVSPSAGIAEICRVLRPGGILVATTFLPRWKSRLQTSQRIMRQVAEKIFGTKIFFFEQELDELFETSGLVNYQKIKIDSYIMVCAQKAAPPAA